MQAPKSGIKFSWCNNRVGAKRILCDLDKAFFNLKWLDKFEGWNYKVGVRDSWEEHCEGKPAFKFMIKLKRFKVTVKKWNWEVFGDLRVKLKQAENDVLSASVLSDAQPENVELLDKLVISRGKYEIVAQQHNELLRAKSRVKWIKEGGANSSFFHANMKIKKAKNTIYEIDNSAVFSMDANSSPGPDGFPGSFYRYSWDVIGAFIKERNIQEKIVLASELVNEMSTKRRGGNVGLKLDITQAYESLSWEFLFEVLRHFGFSDGVIEWLKKIFESTRISVLVNGGPCGLFGVGRGLRQGDPLSPILFVLDEEVLSRNITKLVLAGAIQPMVNRGGCDPAVKKLITVKWDEVCALLKEGGLGLRRFEIINKALLMKLLWKIENVHEEWTDFMRAKYKNKNGEWFTSYKQSSIVPWLEWVMHHVNGGSRWLIGVGKDVSVWKDNWVKDLNELPALGLGKDRKVWAADLNGEFFVANAVQMIRRKYPEVAWEKKGVKVATVIVKQCFFKLPALNQTLLCCDGASRGNPWKAGHGFIARNSDGGCIGAAAGGIGIATNYIAEIMGLICAGEWAVQKQKWNVCFSLDSHAALMAFTIEKVPWMVQNRWQKIKEYLYVISFQHSYREVNTSADTMAKERCSSCKVGMYLL
ncbi:uncharacterized protein LOC113295056 [Papaver somniferum]|uniref:uncharacterized protein LOC113295056 n=1 Tax=Papaver somniferum TaxID=3469 RepID=UPI000E6F90B0|nr:uncharacterized protein LOC113295056 [Papaver somniferum]